MKKFKWRLQRILEIKRKEEELKKNELLKVTEKIVSKQSRLLVEKAKLKRMAEEISEKQPKTRIRQQQLFIRYAQSSNEFIKKVKNHSLTAVAFQNSSFACPLSSSPCLRTYFRIISSVIPIVDTK